VDSAITTKGQATIPKAIREHLGLKPGDRVILNPPVNLREGGNVRVAAQ